MKLTPTVPNTSAMRSAASTDNVGGGLLETTVNNYLRELYERAHDAREGYAKAAELTDDTDLKQVFTENSEQRTQFALELEGVLRALGENPDESTSFFGKIHQGWMQVIAKFSEGEEALLAECERGEEAALSSYQEALDTMELPDRVAAIVERQRDRVKSELVTLGNLKELETVKS